MTNARPSLPSSFTNVKSGIAPSWVPAGYPLLIVQQYQVEGSQEQTRPPRKRCEYENPKLKRFRFDELQVFYNTPFFTFFFKKTRMVNELDPDPALGDSGTHDLGRVSIPREATIEGGRIEVGADDSFFPRSRPDKSHSPFAHSTG